ncbi:MAG TPA: hypothetical protein VG477_17725 [Thermoanaerobaculia bacterium]|nr:hypothetical protein [Thermoanaerobaculia bacterium]
MSHTTDRDREKLDAKTDVGQGTGEGHSVQVVHFDREINVRGILKIGLALVVMAVVVHFLMWWLLRGFEAFEKRKDVRLTPIEQSTPQLAPPEPRLETSPNESLRLMRSQEDELLGHAGWVDQRQGTLRVPIDVAIDVIAARGVAATATAPSAPAAQNAAPQGAPQTPTGQGQAATPPAQ